MNSKEVITYGSCVCLSCDGELVRSTGYLDNCLLASPGDPLKSIFRIVPACSYPIQDFLLSNSSEPDFKDKYTRLLAPLEGEIATNISTALSYKGQVTTFGCKVQLQHVYSNKFLSVSSYKHAVNRDKFKVILTDYASANSTFTLSSAFSFQEEGSALIKPGSKLLISSELKSLENQVFLDVLSESREILGSIDTKAVFMMLAYHLKQPMSSQVNCGDFIQLIYSEASLCLVSDRNYFHKEIVQPALSENLGNGNGIWVIENINSTEGGSLKTGCLYTIKSLTCGKYLATENQQLVLSQDAVDSQWRIMQNGLDEDIFSERYYRIINADTGLTLTAEEQQDLFVKNMYEPRLTEDGLNISYFRIKKCSQYFSSSTAFLVTFQDYLGNFIQDVKGIFEKTEDFKRFSVVLQVFRNSLSELEAFCKNKLPKMISIDVPAGYIDKSKQNTLRDLGFISSLSMILDYFAGKKQVLKNIDKDGHLFKEVESIIKVIFVTLEVISRENQEIQEETFEHINTFCKFIDWHVNVNDFLLSLLSYNENILYKIVNYSHIEKSALISAYFRSLRKHSDCSRPELLELLSAICINGTDAVNANQSIISHFLLKNPDNFSKITLPVLTKNGQSLCLTFSHPTLLGDEIIPLERCFDAENLEFYKHMIDYYTQTLKVFAALCTGKNYVNAEIISAWYTSKILLFNMWNERLSPALRAGFARLFSAIYIEKYSKVESQRIERVKVIEVSNKKLMTRKLMRIETKYDISEVYIESLKPDANKGIEVGEDQGMLHKMKEAIIEYFTEFQQDCFDELTLELIKIALRLLKFEIIDLSVYDPDTGRIISEITNSRFRTQQTGVYRILEVLSKVLFSKDDRKRFDRATFRMKTNRTVSPTNGEFLRQKSVKERDDMNYDPIAAEGQHLLDHFGTLGVAEEDAANYSNSEIECKLKLLEILEFVLDWREDRLVSNILAWFRTYAGRRGMLDQKDLLKLIPPIMEVEHYEKEINIFENFDNLEIPNLAWLGKDFIKMLLKLFCSTSNYLMQNSELHIIMRCFSQRRNLLKSVDKLSLLSNSEDFEVFNWIKVNLVLFSQLSEQSDIWMLDITRGHTLKGDKKLLKMIKVLNNLETSLIEDSFIEEGRITRCLNTDKISKSRQNLITHMDFHRKIIKFVRNSINKLSDIYDDPQTSSDMKSRDDFKILFTLCYKVLKLIVIGNKTNQKIMFGYLEFLLKDLRMSLGQTELICEIFRDNEELCLKVTEKLLNVFVGYIETEGRQERYLDIFKVVQSPNNKPLKEVQRMVIRIFTSSQKPRYLLYIGKDRRFDFDCDLDNINPNFLDQPIAYHCKVLELLAIAAQGKKNIYMTEAKCQKIFSIPMIFETIDAAEMKYSNLEPMRLPLLSFLFHVYIHSEKPLAELNRNVHLVSYIKKHTDNFEESREFVGLMVQIIKTYSKKYLTSSRFGFESFDDYLAIEGFLKNIKRRFQDFSLSQKIIKHLRFLKGLYVFEFECLDESEPVRQASSSVEKKPCDKQWADLKSNLISSDFMVPFLKSEKKALMNIIINIEEYLEGISFEDFLKKIVDFIRQAHHKNPTIEILKNCINFIIAILSKAIAKNKFTKEEIQNKLCDLGLVKIILNLMCLKENHDKIFYKFVQLSIEMLDGGNLKVQGEFYKYFVQSEHSEKFFQKIFHFLNTANSNKVASPKVFKESKNSLLKILRLMQLLCENHNSDLQNYLRYQENSSNNYDLIEATVNLFGRLMAAKSNQSFLVISQCLDTLTELIQGPCEGNQKDLISLGFLEISIKLLSINQQHFTSGYLPSELLEESEAESCTLTGWMIVHLKYKLSITLLSLLEVNNDDYIISLMYNAFSDSLFYDNLNQVYSSFVKIYDYEEYHNDIFGHFEKNKFFRFGVTDIQSNNEEYFMSVIEVGFNLYHLMRYLKDHERKIKNLNPETKFQQLSLPKWLNNELLMNLYFFGINLYKSFKDIFKRIRKKRSYDKKEIASMSIRFFETHTGRIEVALADSRIIHIYYVLKPESLYLTEEIKLDFHEWADRSSEKSKLQYLQLSSLNLQQEILNEQRIENFFKKYPLLSIITSNVQLWISLGFTTTLLLNFILISSYHTPVTDPDFKISFCLKTDGKTNCLETMSETETIALFSGLGIVHTICAVLVFFFQVIKVWPKLYSYYFKHYTGHRRRILRELKRPLPALLTLINPRISYYIFYSCISLVAVSIKAYYLYSFHLLDVIFRFPSLQNVVKSIYYSRKSLTITFIFIIVLVYYFTLWGYARLQQYYGLTCTDLLSCMAYTYDQGFKLGMGWTLDDWPYGTFANERVFFDNLHYIAILIMMMNFIKGIIFDSFFVLRDANEKNDWDRENVCFICGLEREIVERKSGRSFAYHVKNEHYLWNYAFYIMIVMSKDKTELSSIESYVRNCYDQNNIGWYPQGCGLSFKEKEDNEPQKFEQEVNEIKEIVRRSKEKLEGFKQRQKETKAPILALQKLRGENEDLRNELRQISSKLDEVLSKQHSEAPPVKNDTEIKISSAQKLIASIEREIESMKSSASSSSIESKLKLEEESVQLKEKLKTVTAKNKELQRQVNDGSRKIESITNNPEESKDLKIILEQLRTSKEKLKEIETRYQGESQRSQMIQSKINDLESQAKELGINIAVVSQAKTNKNKGEGDKKESENLLKLKNQISDYEKEKANILSSIKKSLVEVEEEKRNLTEENNKLVKILKDKEHEWKLKEYEIKELKRNLRNLQMKQNSVPEINIESDKPQQGKQKKKGKNEEVEEDKPKEAKPKIRKISMHEEEKEKKNKKKKEGKGSSSDENPKEHDRSSSNSNE